MMLQMDDHDWHHAAWVYDGSSLKLYVDGVLKSTSAISGKGAGLISFRTGVRAFIYKCDHTIVLLRICHVLSILIITINYLTTAVVGIPLPQHYATTLRLEFSRGGQRTTVSNL